MQKRTPFVIREGFSQLLQQSGDQTQACLFYKRNSNSKRGKRWKTCLGNPTSLRENVDSGSQTHKPMTKIKDDKAIENTAKGGRTDASQEIARP